MSHISVFDELMIYKFNKQLLIHFQFHFKFYMELIIKIKIVMRLRIGDLLR